MISLIMIFIVSSSKIHRETEYYSNILIELSIIMLLYDIVFLVFHTGLSQLNGPYTKFLSIINIIGFVIKIILLISFVVIKVEGKKKKEANEEINNQ